MDGRRELTARTRSARKSPKTPRTWKKFAQSFKPSAFPPRPNWLTANRSSEIIKWVQQKGCDLVAMSTHGHRFLADLFLGTTATQVQHSISVPVLLLRAK